MERADNSVALANFHLAFAGRRLDEIDQLLLLEQPTAIPTAAERYIYHARQTEAILLATRVVSAADRDEFDDTLGLGSSVQESFSQNILRLLASEQGLTANFKKSIQHFLEALGEP